MQANQQGTFYKSLTINRNEKNYSNTILKNEFLKKTENYSCIVQDFVSNVTPPLNDSSEVAFQIFIRNDAGTVVANATFPAHWNIEDTRFTTKPYFSTMEFLRQAQYFFHRFGFLVRTIGVVGIAGTLNAAGRAQGYPFLKQHYVGPNDRGWGTLPDEGRMIKCRMKSDGVFVVEMNVESCNHFYIQVGPETQRLLGLNPTLHVIALDNGTHTSTTVDLLGPPAVVPLTFGADLQINNPVTQPGIFESKNALHQLDERLSIDVVATLPFQIRFLPKTVLRVVISFSQDSQSTTIINLKQRWRAHRRG